MPKLPPLPLYRTRRRWTEKEAREALAALAASRLSTRAFATREGNRFPAAVQLATQARGV